MADFIRCSLCLTDIPKEAIRKAENGKLYLSIVVCEKKEADQYGNTHYIALSQTKEQREAGEKRVYLGDGKAYVPATPKVEDVDAMPAAGAEVDDLPF